MLDHSGGLQGVLCSYFSKHVHGKAFFGHNGRVGDQRFLLLMLMKQPLASCKIFHIIFSYIDIILTYVHIYTWFSL